MEVPPDDPEHKSEAELLRVNTLLTARGYPCLVYTCANLRTSRSEQNQLKRRELSNLAASPPAVPLQPGPTFCRRSLDLGIPSHGRAAHLVGNFSDVHEPLGHLQAARAATATATLSHRPDTTNGGQACDSPVSLLCPNLDKDTRHPKRVRKQITGEDQLKEYEETYF